MGPEKIQNHQEENNENTGWESLQNAEIVTSKSAIFEKIKNNNSVKKAFIAVGLAAGLVAGIAAFNSSSEPIAPDAVETTDVEYDEMLDQAQDVENDFVSSQIPDVSETEPTQPQPENPHFAPPTQPQPEESMPPTDLHAEEFSPEPQLNHHDHNNSPSTIGSDGPHTTDGIF